MDDLLKNRAVDILVEDLQLQLALMKTKQRLLVEMREPIDGALKSGGKLDEHPALKAKLKSTLVEIEYKQTILRQNHQGTEEMIAQYEALRPSEEDLS
ncbi:MAG: hypothetical protein P8104_10215 [Gammaproteobacteria bacterium]|jgi:hypothetical protein